MKLSIITINYNNLEGLQRTINSIICQIWRDFEWIVIDGGSYDGSKELIEKYQDHFVYWCSEPDKGIYNAMNKGLIRAKGDYCIFMNSGDSFYDNKTLENIFSIKRNADVIYGDGIEEYEDGRERYESVPHNIDLYDIVINGICQQYLYVKTDLLKVIGFDESYRIVSDHIALIKLALNNVTFEHVGFPVCRYDMSGISSTQKQECIEENKKAISDILPSNIMVIIGRIYSCEENHIFKRSKSIVDKGGLISWFLKFYLKLFG